MDGLEFRLGSGSISLLSFSLFFFLSLGLSRSLSVSFLGNRDNSGVYGDGWMDSDWVVWTGLDWEVGKKSGVSGAGHDMDG